MPNRKLTIEELKSLAAPLLKSVRARLVKLTAGDSDLLFALRRKLSKELQYDERGKPMARRKLKMAKALEQDGRCPLCKKRLPDRGAVLDRIVAMRGYTTDNTRLLCPPCDTTVQKERNYA